MEEFIESNMKFSELMKMYAFHDGDIYYLSSPCVVAEYREFDMLEFYGVLLQFNI